MTNNFDIETFKQILLSASQGDNRRRYVFAPAGTHEVRFFADPLSKGLRLVVVHMQNKSRVWCPRAINKTDRCLICELASQTNIWTLRAQARGLIYTNVLKTNAPSAYWAPGECYVLVMNRLLCSELITFIEKIGAQNWQQSLNPSHASPYVQLKINRGSVQITPSQIMAETPVIKTDENPEWWSPLDNIWVPRDFDRIDYRIMLSSVLREHSNDISSDLLNAVKKEIRLESPDE